MTDTTVGTKPKPGDFVTINGIASYDHGRVILLAP